MTSNLFVDDGGFRIVDSMDRSLEITRERNDHVDSINPKPVFSNRNNKCNIALISNLWAESNQLLQNTISC